MNLVESPGIALIVPVDISVRVTLYKIFNSALSNSVPLIVVMILLVYLFGTLIWISLALQHLVVSRLYLGRTIRYLRGRGGLGNSTLPLFFHADSCVRIFLHYMETISVFS